jgi:multiple sugar transport system ATP-binding protein
LSNLDAKLRVQTRADLIELQERLTTTVVYVTHDQIEAMTMGHRIAIIADGALQQVGPPQEVYERPRNRFVAEFIGTPPMNIINARVVMEGGAPAVSLPGARVPLPEPLAHLVGARGLDEIAVGVRPEHLLLAVDGFVPATVSVVESLGHERNIACRLDDGTLIITRQDMDAPRPTVGETVRLTTAPEFLHVFDSSGERVDAP